MEEQRPDAVVLDINLGSGPTFKLAETLKDGGILFVLVTGYDEKVIPKQSIVERVIKPVELQMIVGLKP